MDDGNFRHMQQRQRLLGAIQRFKGLFEPQQQFQRWDQVAPQYVVPDDGLQLAQFSYVARELWPLRSLKEQDRQDLIERINGVLAEIDNDNQIPSWARAPLADGLSRLRFALTHLVFLGHELAISELHNCYLKTIDLEDAIAAQKGGSSLKAIRRALEIIALAGALFCLPHEVGEALEDYQNTILNVLIKSERLPPPQQPRLLPKPVAAKPKLPSEQEGNA